MLSGESASRERQDEAVTVTNSRLVLNDRIRRDNLASWKGRASAPPPPPNRRVGPLGPEAKLLQGLQPPVMSRFPWRG